MSYTVIDTIPSAAKAQVRIALIKQAAVRSQAAYTASTQATPDYRERNVCTAILNGSMPDSYVTMVLIVLDIASSLPVPTDAQVDTVITTGITTPVTVSPVWQFLISTARTS